LLVECYQLFNLSTTYVLHHPIVKGIYLHARYELSQMMMISCIAHTIELREKLSCVMIAWLLSTYILYIYIFYEVDV